MAWTAIIGPEEAQGELKELYDALEARGITLTAEFLGVYTQEPGILRWLTAGLKPGYGTTAIETTLTQMIATVVSVVNGLRQLPRRPRRADAAHAGGTTPWRTRFWRTTPRRPWSPRSRAALDYAVKLTREPRGVHGGRRAAAARGRLHGPADRGRGPRGRLVQLREPHRPGAGHPAADRGRDTPQGREASVYSASLVVIAAVSVMVLLWVGFMAWAYLSGQMRESERARRLPFEDDESSTNGEAHG